MIDNTMTAARHRRKLGCVGLSAGLLPAIVGLAILAGPFTILAATTEYVVVERNSGLAIGGYDPVAYFTEGAARLGKGDFEQRFAGAVWRFRNEGNLGAFVADPEIYMPRFGGYDAVAIARGVAIPGDPRLWVIAQSRLAFFATPEARELFLNDWERIAAAAERTWPSVQLTLVP